MMKLRKKGSGSDFVLGMVVMIVLIGAYFFCSNMGYIDQITKPNMSDAFKIQLDRIAPDYIKNKELACTDHNGEWFETHTQFGCFDVGTDWDSSWCESDEGSLVENICNSLDAKWVCDQNNAGCLYD